MSPAQLRLEMRGIWKSFGGVKVLRDVDLHLERGEVLALLGSNGAGKSTLVRLLSGALTTDSGEILIDGVACSFATPADAVRRGICLLPQEVSIFGDLTVAENIVMGSLPVRRRVGITLVDTEAMRDRALRLLRELGLSVRPEQPMRELSVSEQRVVEIARAVASNASILIMDEPTAALSEHEVAFLFDIIRRLKSAGVALIYISHYLDEVFRISDRIVVLRDGANAGQFVTRSASQADVTSAMLGATAGGLYPPRTGTAGNTLLEVDRLSVPGRLQDVRLSVARGEIVGVFGLIGSGIEVIGRAIYGALGAVPDSRMRLAGRDYRPSTPEAAKRRGIGLVAAERKKEALIPELTVRENTTLPFLRLFGPSAMVARGRETVQTEHWIHQLGIRTQGTEQQIRFLSGGNQQKVCIARWLLGEIALLILEEPTRGVDIGARREIYAELRRLADQGMGLLVISSDVEEVSGLADRTIVLDRGRVARTFGPDAQPAALMASASEAAALA